MKRLSIMITFKKLTGIKAVMQNETDDDEPIG